MANSERQAVRFRARRLRSFFNDDCRAAVCHHVAIGPRRLGAARRAHRWTGTFATYCSRYPQKELNFWSWEPTLWQHMDC